MQDRTRDSGMLTTSERIELARAKMVAIVDHLIHMMELRAANDIVVFSDTLAKQIPYSRAAVAFNVFQHASFRFEIVRLCAVWDLCKPSELDSKNSIPAVVRLVDDAAVIHALVEETRAAHQHGFPHIIETPHYRASDPAVIAATQNIQQAFADRQAAKADRWLRTAISWTTTHERGRRLEAIRNYRDKEIAHSLTQTWLEAKKAKAGDTVDRMANGDARWLFRRTLVVANCLYLAVNGRSFDWAGSVKVATRNAKELWHNCRFDLPADRRRDPRATT